MSLASTTQTKLPTSEKCRKCLVWRELARVSRQGFHKNERIEFRKRSVQRMRRQASRPGRMQGRDRETPGGRGVAYLTNATPGK
jgi:hypothetical protein